MNLSSLRKVRLGVPSVITSLNMCFGFLAIACCLGVVKLGENPQVAACWFIVCAAALDALDGKIARILGAASKFGIQFDSLADMISFGLAPAVLLISFRDIFVWPLFLIGFAFLVAGAARLARFNVQTKSFDKKNFTGLPIPAAAAAVCSYIIFSYHIWHELRYFNSFLLLAVLAALLMVSTIEYETYPKFTLRTLRSRLLLGLFVTLLVLLFRWPSLLLFVFTWVYILFGIVRWIVLAVRPQSNEDNEEPERPVSFGD